MKYDAITIDTQTVEHSGFHFEGGLLSQIKQFAIGPTKVIVSQVVLSEIYDHLRSKVQSASAAMETAHSKAIQYGLKPNTSKAFEEPIDASKVALAQIKSYFSSIGAAIIPVDTVQVKELWGMYIRGVPPFSKSGAKKNEFPDAIALLSLEDWAKTNNKKVLAVSGDKDWERFATHSTYIDQVDDLAVALEMLQEQREQAESLAKKLIDEIDAGSNATLRETFSNGLEEAVSNCQFDGDGNSDYSFECEQVDTKLNGYDLSTNGENQYRIVQAGPLKLVVDLDVRLHLQVDGTFSFYLYDSLDKDYVGMGSSTFRREDESIELSVLITFEGDMDAGAVTITAVEIIGEPITIDFDYIRPDMFDDRDQQYEPTQNAGDPFPDEFS